MRCRYATLARLLRGALTKMHCLIITGYQGERHHAYQMYIVMDCIYSPVLYTPGMYDISLLDCCMSIQTYNNHGNWTSKTNFQGKDKWVFEKITKITNDEKDITEIRVPLHSLGGGQVAPGPLPCCERARHTAMIFGLRGSIGVEMTVQPITGFQP